MNLGGIMVSPLELERIIDGHPAVYESAAVAVQPEGEGVERLVVFVVPEGGSGTADSRATIGSRAAGSRATIGSRAAGSRATIGSRAANSETGLDRDLDPAPDSDSLKSELQAMVSSGLNPLFKIYRVIIVDELPHTASGKLVRRALRESLRQDGDVS